MKIQVGANCVVIGSKALGQKNPKVAAAATACAAGKQKLLVVTLVDDDGNDCNFTVPLRSFKGGSFGGYLSGKGEGRIIEVDVGVSKVEEKLQKADAKLQALTDELLAE
jgi:hypothetical protein